MVCPNGKMEKIMHFSLGGFFLCSVLIPIFSISKNFDIKLKNTENNKTISKKLEKKAAEQLQNLSSKQIKESINKILNKEGIATKKIELLMDTNNNTRISINKIKLFFDEKYLQQKEKIQGILKRELGEIKIQICETLE
jgi:hypothetical protein